MKILYLVLVVFISVYIAGCNNSDVVDPNSGINGTGTGNTVNFTMQGSGTSQSYDFQFTPGVDVKLNYLIASLPAQQFSDSVPNTNPSTVFSSGQSYSWYPYTGVQTGQQWSFTFNGTTVSSNQSFTSTVSFTIP
ncbi:MAG: hypothetical protein KDC73_10375 [Ignavibacteriae bacterium]|nr:hypothetical protein [Ignavibacteriota bacterium]MCB9242574.1 hypothetical protein [Ignavibacteriales bacterium]